jgi:hypothetical protein
MLIAWGAGPRAGKAVLVTAFNLPITTRHDHVKALSRPGPAGCGPDVKRAQNGSFSLFSGKRGFASWNEEAGIRFLVCCVMPNLFRDTSALQYIFCKKQFACDGILASVSERVVQKD